MAADTKSLLQKQGMGNWDAWGTDITSIQRAAIEWKKAAAGIELPWLCWNVDSDWCLLQQRLVAAAGWTPVVGFDPRVGPPSKVIKEAVLIDFNKDLGLPVLYPHFPLEFVFLWCERLAFWHSDLLVRKNTMVDVAKRFRELPQGSTTAVSSVGWRNFLFPSKQRYWELIGCTTSAASKSQFDHGCGWWMHFYAHPNKDANRGDPHLRNHYWDHGAGVMYWRRKHGGKVVALSERDFAEGHFSEIKFDGYKRVSPNNEFRQLSLDLANNFQLKSCATRLGLEEYLTED